ncbi:hypothetical protein LCGC14_2936410 [marine sediment metagenome]|uniref:Uncharacterized protein n=1 Tax=marine sediment metagenome TaxID=412755 RepID=A0A0F8XJW5_9ZZZZ
MKKPTYKEIIDMSITFEGAKKASIWKWEWMCMATKKEIRSGEWPECGFCVFYKNKCNDCVLKHCFVYWGNKGWVNPLYEKIVQTWWKLRKGKVTIKQFRIVAKRMLKVIEGTKE